MSGRVEAWMRRWKPEVVTSAASAKKRRFVAFSCSFFEVNLFACKLNCSWWSLLGLSLADSLDGFGIQGGRKTDFPVILTFAKAWKKIFINLHLGWALRKKINLHNAVMFTEKPASLWFITSVVLSNVTISFKIGISNQFLRCRSLVDVLITIQMMSRELYLWLWIDQSELFISNHSVLIGINCLRLLETAWDGGRTERGRWSASTMSQRCHSATTQRAYKLSCIR